MEVLNSSEAGLNSQGGIIRLFSDQEVKIKVINYVNDLRVKLEYERPGTLFFRIDPISLESKLYWQPRDNRAPIIIPRSVWEKTIPTEPLPKAMVRGDKGKAGSDKSSIFQRIWEVICELWNL